MRSIQGKAKWRTSLETWPTYAGVFLAPFINLRIDLAFTLSSALYCLASAAMLCRGTIARNPLGIMAWTWVPAFFLIVTGLHVSSLANGDPVRGLVLTLSYSFCFVVLPFILLKSKVTDCYRLLTIFASGVVVLDAHGIFAFFAIGYVPGDLTVTGNLRLATLIGNPNGAACLNAITILILVWLLAEERVSKVVGFVYLAVAGLALILTSSNTGLLAVIGGLLVYVSLTFRLRNSLRLLCVLAIPTAFFSVFGMQHLPQTFQKRVLSALVEGEVSEAGTYLHRSDLNWEAIDVIERRQILFLGLGADQFREISVQQAPVHNVFLILWVEGGILSLLGWLLLMSSGIIVWARARAQGIMVHGRAAVLAAFVIFIVVSNARAHLYTPYWYTAVLLILAPTIATLRQHAAEIHERGRRASPRFDGVFRKVSRL